MKIAIVSGISTSARDLVRTIQAGGFEATKTKYPLEGHFNVGWGVSNPMNHLNKQIPPNKLWELQTCANAGVNTVPFILNGEVPPREWEEIFGRRLSHTKGRDILHCQRGEPYGGRDFYTRVVPKYREYRVHVFNGLAVRTGTKTVTRNGELVFPNIEQDGHIWNLDHGCQIRYEFSAPAHVRELAKQAVKALGLDFAAVDVIEDNNRVAYFLEANTRPGLHGNTVIKYATKIIEASTQV